MTEEISASQMPNPRLTPWHWKHAYLPNSYTNSSRSTAPSVMYTIGVENGRGESPISAAIAGYSTRKRVARKKTITTTEAASEYVKAHSPCVRGTLLTNQGKNKLTTVSRPATSTM